MIYQTMWNVCLVAALGFVHIVGTQEEEKFQSIKCIRDRPCANSEHKIDCDQGQKIVISSVEVLIGEDINNECNCTIDSDDVVCIDNSDPDDWTKRCYGEETCNIPARPMPMPKPGYFREVEGCDSGEGQLHLIQSRVEYMCGYDNRQEDSGSKSTLVVIVAVVSSLVVLLIVLIVFAAVYMYKRKKSKKSELYRDRSMHDAQYHSSGGFDEEYNTIPADYDGRISTREHKYYTIAEPKNGSIATSNGKTVTETDNDYDKARHDRPALPSYTDRNAYSSNAQNASNPYNKIVFNKPNNEEKPVDDYSHLSQPANDYSRLGNSPDHADPVSDDYNRLQDTVETKAVAGSYGDALSPSKDESDDETSADRKNDKKSVSFGEPTEINTSDPSEDIVNSDAPEPKVENLSEMNSDSLQLPSKKTTEESGKSSIAGDCSSLDSYDSLSADETSQQIGTIQTRRDSYEIPDIKVDEINDDKAEEGDAKVDNDSLTDNASLDDTRISDMSVRSGGSFNS